MSIDDRTGSGRFAERAFAGFRERFAGELIRPEDPGYDEARAIWNGMIDRRPALVAKCTGTADVVAAINFARENDLLVAVRGGGHNVSGNAVCDAGIVVDLSPMRGVWVDRDARRAWAQGGALLGDVDRETQLYGLATPLGVVSKTGIAGLTLGGGLGNLRRKYGLACDALRSAEVVTADGNVVTASEDEHADLFWALRGGGGNFGVVTGFEYELYPVGPDVSALLVFQPADTPDRMRAALKFFREFTADAPDEVSVVAFTGWIPPEEELFDPAIHDEPFVAFLGCYAGDPDEGTDALAPLREFDTPLVDFSGEMPYTTLQSMLDEDYPDGMRYYWKSVYLDALSDEAIDEIVAHAYDAPSHLSTVDVWHLGGAIARVDADATAFAERDAPYLFNPEANWVDAAEDDANVAWVRDFDAAMQPYARGGLYLNFPGFNEGGEQEVEETYGDGYERLVDVKTEYDPENLFRLNQNVEPRTTD